MKTKMILFLCVICFTALLSGTQEVKAQRTKFVPCNSCGGRGYQSCSACSGSGRVSQLIRGRSTTNYMYVTCTSCRGNGRTACWSCSGRGGAEVPDYDTPDATIESVWVDHDVTQDDKKGMRIHVNFSVYGLKNKTGEVRAYFYHSDGRPVKVDDWYRGKGYNTEEGHVGIAEDFKPSYNDSVYEDFKLFIPYHVFDLGSGSHRLKFYVQVYRGGGSGYLDEESYSFTYTK